MLTFPFVTKLSPSVQASNFTMAQEKLLQVKGGKRALFVRLQQQCRWLVVDRLYNPCSQGVLPALVTPFLLDGGVDTAAVEQLVKVRLCRHAAATPDDNRWHQLGSSQH